MKTIKQIRKMHKQIIAEIDECQLCLDDATEKDKLNNPKTFDSIKRNKLRLDIQKGVFEWILGIENEL